MQQITSIILKEYGMKNNARYVKKVIGLFKKRFLNYQNIMEAELLSVPGKFFL